MIYCCVVFDGIRSDDHLDRIKQNLFLFFFVDVMTTATLLPYGLPCIQELLRFLITLINPLDKQNTDAMIHMGLNLLTIALEVGADSIGKYDTLLEMVKDGLCRNLFSVSIYGLTAYNQPPVTKCQKISILPAPEHRATDHFCR